MILEILTNVAIALNDVERTAPARARIWLSRLDVGRNRVARKEPDFDIVPCPLHGKNTTVGIVECFTKTGFVGVRSTTTTSV